MTIQPIYHWLFDEREGTVVKDRINGVVGALNNIAWDKFGRISGAIKVQGNSSHINFGNVVGQFGTSDFTVVFGMKVIDTHGDNEMDIIGNRTGDGHRNVFSAQLRDKTKIFFQVDEDPAGMNFIEVATPPLSLGSDKKWHHIALVREKTTLKIYVDGSLVAQNSLIIKLHINPIPVIGASSDLTTINTTTSSTTTTTSLSDIANISNGKDFRLGDWTKGTAVAQYEDLRIYHTALNALQIENLVPPYNRFLRPGQVELIGPDDAAIILSKDVADLSSFSNEGFKVRFGPDTGINLYAGTNFGGATNKFYADISNVKLGESFPRSIRVWSSVGEPFTGNWVIKAPNDQFLSWNDSFLTTSPSISSKEFFVLTHNLHNNQPQFIPVNDRTGRLFPLTLLMNQPESRKGTFSVVNMSRDQWLMLKPDKTFSWTSEHSKRAIFAPAVKIADNEGQVGEIVEGEVAFYEHSSYVGKTWVLSDSDPLTLGSYPDLRIIPGLNDALSSVRLGSNTGVTLFAHPNNQVNEAKRETEVEDLTENTPNMGEGQIGHDKVSGAKIFRTVASETIFNSFTSTLSEDYRLVDDKLEQFSAYRTILRFAPGIGEVEISATDLTTILVEGKSFEIDEVRSVTLRPNELNQLMITSEADGITTPGLKFRTSGMAENERVVIFPDQEVHQQIAKLEDDALWNAKDAKGNLIVDQAVHTKSEIASIQNTIKRVMSTVAYTDTVVDIAPAESAVNTAGFSSIAQRSAKSSNQIISGATISNPWELHFALSTSGSTGGSLVATGDIIREQTLTQSAFAQLWAQANPITTNVLSVRSIGASLRGGFFSDIKDAVKRATSVVIGFANDALQTIIRIGNEVISFVLDTAAKVATFVEAIVEKVVASIKQFVEFLRFIFDWDDILETKRFLTETINAAFDSASALVVSAKEPVSEFFDSLKEGVDDGIDSLIRSIGVDPSEEQNSKFELPEAAEWFLNKLLGGFKSLADDAQDAVSDEVGDLSGIQLPPLVQGLMDLMERLQHLADTGSHMREVLIEIFETLIANPLKPELALVEIFEAIRNLGREFLDIGEDAALIFLDFVVESIEGLRDVLNAEIRVPLISELFELLGAGRLTLLNLTSVLLAIPSTILSKLLFDKAPFKDVSQPVFPSQDLSSPGLRNISAQEDEPTIDAENTQRKMIGFGVVALSADLLNGTLTSFLDLIPEEFDDLFEPVLAPFEVVSLVLSGFSWLASFPASRVEEGGYPYNICLDENNVNKHENEKEYWERVMWGWRTFVLGSDIVYMGVARAATLLAPNNEIFKNQRLSRATEATAGFIVVFTLVDIGLTGRYLGTLTREDKVGREISNEMLALLPTLFCWLRMTGSYYALLGQFAINVISTGATTGLNAKILTDNVRSLD